MQKSMGSTWVSIYSMWGKDCKSGCTLSICYLSMQACGAGMCEKPHSFCFFSFQLLHSRGELRVSRYPISLSLSLDSEDRDSVWMQ